jgi:starch-binding outer membrane protein, SusD/RagB family
MKKIYKTLQRGSILLVIALSLFSCEEYLEKEPESIVSEEVAFSNFNNFQGFIEEIYNCIPDKEKCYWTTSWNWGEDEVFNLEGSWHMTNQVDLGNFWNWQSNNGQWLNKSDTDPTSTDKFKHALWPHAWYSIRKANMGLENLDKLTSATQEERDILTGQLYFFRGWWYFEMMQYFGGLPYINSVLPSSEKFNFPRLPYQQLADSIARDFQMAVDLLPIDWDNNTTVGRNTLGKNQLRANKIMALGYLGKNYLWAGSPLMENGAQTGGAKAYDYNAEYCKKAAEAFGELLNLVESGGTQYALVDFDYSDIYNHKSNSDTKYSDMFYTTGQGWMMPGATEAIFRGPSTDFNGSNWNTTKTFGPKVNGLVEHDNIIHQPTANYVNYYGMANGLPLDDPESGFDPDFPFKDRDPRFYHDIVFDGFKYVNSTMPADQEFLRYTSLYSGGAMRGAADGSRTGYLIQKLVPHTANKYDGAYNWSFNLHTYLPYMRLGDIYTMYAEACAAFGGATGKSTNFSKTAEDAINTLRERVGAGNVNAKYTADRTNFIDEVRRERAVELSFEGFRFNDLQRWLLLTEYPYNVKTSQEFTRVEDNSFFEENDPRDARVSNFREEVILTRQFSAKHYWFPLKVSDVSIYPEFEQNPGW